MAGDRTIVYMMTRLRSSSDAILPISFGANRATQWWMNGKPVYESIKDWRDPDDRASHQLEAPITKGNNLLAIRLIGSSTGCSIRISKLNPRPQAKSKPVAILEKPSVSIKSGKIKGNLAVKN